MQGWRSAASTPASSSSFSSRPSASPACPAASAAPAAAPGHASAAAPAVLALALAREGARHSHSRSIRTLQATCTPRQSARKTCGAAAAEAGKRPGWGQGRHHNAAALAPQPQGAEPGACMRGPVSAGVCWPQRASAHHTLPKLPAPISRSRTRSRNSTSQLRASTPADTRRASRAALPPGALAPGICGACACLGLGEQAAGQCVQCTR